MFTAIVIRIRKLELPVILVRLLLKGNIYHMKMVATITKED